MTVHRMGQMTWTELDSLDRTRTACILPIGATEAHGPHLPLATDVIIAEAMAVRGGELLSERGWTSVVLPPITYSAAPFAASFPGTVSLNGDTVVDTIVDLAGNLARSRFESLILANAHFDPAHLQSLYRAVDSIRQASFQERGTLNVVFPDATRRPWALRLTDEFKSGACHAGRYEGSIVLAQRPEWVREEIARGLPANPVSLSEAIQAGKKDFEEAGGDQAYFGYPAQASAEEGRETIESLGSILAEGFQHELGQE